MRRWKELWPWGLAILAILILAIGQIEFVPDEERPATFNPLDLFRQPASSLPMGPSSPVESLGPDLDAVVGRLLLYVVLPLAFAIYFVSIVISPQTRRHALALLVTLLMVVAVLMILFYSRSGASPAAGGQAAEVGPASGGDLPVIAPAEPAGWIVWLAAVALSLALLGGAYLLWRRFFRHPRRSLAGLAGQAQAALQELQSGTDLRDVVTRCYVEMSRIVGERRGLRRRESLTPREFAYRLTAAGLPAEDVYRLTRLFERVRYADQPPGPAEQQEATACLEAIVAAVGDTG